MTFLDTLSLAFRNLRQSKLRTALTMLGVSIGIASLTGMVSLGVGLQDQLVGRFTQSGMFDSITVTSAALPGQARQGGPGGRNRSATPRPRLDDKAIAALLAMADVKTVYPTLRLPVQLKLGDHTEFTVAAGVPQSSGGEGVFQTMAHGRFFADASESACLLTLDMAKRLTDADPKDLVGRVLTIGYAMKAPGGAPALPANPMAAAMQVQRKEMPCPIVGIIEVEAGPAFAGSSVVSPLMLPMTKAQEIHAVQVTGAQSLLRQTEDDQAYQSVTVKVSSAQRTQDVEAKIKALGYSAFSLNDLLRGAKRAFLILDVVLAVIGSIALAVSSLGIVNTMVMSILERTREIGVMKAIGGSDADVRKIFLIEASTIGIIGGIAGIGLGWGVSRVVNFGVNVYIQRQGGTPGDLFSLPLWLIGGAIGFSLLISLMAGSYPAHRAARLDPIQALRHD